MPCSAARLLWLLGEECKIFTLQPRLHQGLHPLAADGPEREEHTEQEFQKQRPENYQNGRERPHFFGFQPPKKFRGSLPPSPTGRDSCTVASTGENGEP